MAVYIWLLQMPQRNMENTAHLIWT